jgi:hypothetical protein
MGPRYLSAFPIASLLALAQVAVADPSTTSTTVVSTTSTTEATSTTVVVTTTTTSTSLEPSTTSTTETTTTSTSSSSTTSTSTSTTSTTSTSIQVCTCSDLPFAAELAVKLSSGATVNNDAGVNETQGVAILAPDATMANGTTLYADRVKLGPGADVYDVRTNSLKVASTDGIHGNVDPIALPLKAPFCQQPPLTCGTGDVTVAGQAELTLPAGDYGRVSIGSGGTLHLPDDAPYRFCELRVANYGSVLATHQITIEVPGNVFVGTRCTLRTGGGAPLVLRVGGSKLLLGREAVVTAAITAPNAKGKVKSDSAFSGCMCARVAFVD